MGRIRLDPAVLAKAQRRARIQDLGELVARRMPTEILEGSDERFDEAVRALRCSTLDLVVQEAVEFLPDPHVDPDEADQEDVPWLP